MHVDGEPSRMEARSAVLGGAEYVGAGVSNFDPTPNARSSGSDRVEGDDETAIAHERGALPTVS